VWVAGQLIESDTVLWTAGVQASPLIKQLEVKTDRAGRAMVGELLDIPGYPDAFRHRRRVGRGAQWAATARRGAGRYSRGHICCRLISARLAGRSFTANSATGTGATWRVVGKNFAVLERGKLQMSGTLIWILWALIHVMFLPQVQNRCGSRCNGCGVTARDSAVRA